MAAKIYRAPADMPETIPVFPLTGALLLPRGRLPLNIFEPRYLAMTDDAMSGARIIGMIQPEKPEASTPPPLFPVGCAGRIVSYEESADGRILITLSGISRFRLREELNVGTLYRQCRVDFTEFAGDFTADPTGAGVDRQALLQTLRNYLDANRIEADWSGIRDAPIEALVNGLSMMSPFGTREKQALLEAADLKSRAELLIAVTEFSLAEPGEDGETSLQ
jgi:Lon protease-like protein